MATLFRNPFVTDAYDVYAAIDSCFDLDDALTFPGYVAPGGYQINTSRTSESDSSGDAFDDSSSDAFVANLPTIAAVEGATCSVCVEGFVSGGGGGGGGGRAKVVPCGHVYHETCISKWLSHSNSCPLCRSAIINPRDL